MRILFTIAIFAIVCLQARGQDPPDAATQTFVTNWLTKITPVAAAGNVDSMMKLGDFYENKTLYSLTGIYVANPWFNAVSALQWYDKGRYAGNKWCYFKLANSAIKNSLAGDPIPYDTIITWLRLAEPQTADVYAELGAVYQYGTKNRQLAEEAYTKAARLGDNFSAARLQEFKMSQQDAFAMGAAARLKNDSAEMLKWYEVSANYQKNGEAAYYVGQLHDAGVRGYKDAATALGWYKYSGQLGYAKGWFSAARNRYSVWSAEHLKPRNTSYMLEALEYMRLADSLGYPEASQWIGWIKKEDKEYIEQLAQIERNRNERLAQNNTGTVPATKSAEQPVAKRLRWCTECHGTGKVATIEYYTDRSSGLQSGRTVYRTCGTCYGKGSY